MERVSFIEYKGKKFLYMDVSNLDAREMLENIANAKKIIRSQPEKSVFVLTDVTGMRFDSEVTTAMKEYVAGNKPYVVASAVVGVTGLKMIVVNSIMKFAGRKLVLFDTIEQAKDWLVQQ
ncbi:MAG: hypothetical protein ABSD50_15940 [Smithella sp.]|jgi:hypothetical protein